jgi:hypothetical protein
MLAKQPMNTTPKIRGAAIFLACAAISLGPYVGAAQERTEDDHGVVFDFMFLPHKDTGWYLEPSWSRTADSGEQTIGLTGGFLFGWH